MGNGFDAELVEITRQLGLETETDPLRDLHNYNDEMTISQVVKFFNRQGVTLTKTMVQNYVRVGILPPPFEKRYYRREHLIMLTLIDRFKSIYSLGEIRQAYTPASEESDGEMYRPTVEEMPGLYKDYLDIYKEVATEAEQALSRDLERLNREEGGERIKRLLLLTLMTRSMVMKRMVEMILEKPTTTDV